VTIAIPRSATVSVGTPGRKLPMSPITMASAAKRSGRDGGYVLTRPPGKITVLDVVRAIDGSDPAFRCTEIRQNGELAAPPEDCRRPCGIAKVMADAERAWQASLSATTIADLAATVDTDAVRAVLGRR
jgi:DNA-binding IscR family transcriptional regulator